MNVTRKTANPVSKESARLVVSTYTTWCIETTPAEIATTFRIDDESRIGFWDALILASAVKSGADRILSEDLKVGQTISGLLIQTHSASIR